ncbi:hypothetical protein [Bauldia litoralis]|uniref:Thymidylate kinase n=1 Tax=Bauldia litoralis TaxID=665467 RepID=A0A1G6CVB8_9HYPH|nr:hypothetical protein [Bauldia litoralis]SDB36784.1 Thymidylate kinase [Bauldia litoralis]
MTEHLTRTGKRGFMVAFVGVDGAGKSTAVLDVMADPAYRNIGVKRVYLGSNEYWIPGALRLNAVLISIPVLKYISISLLILDRQLRLFRAMYFRWRGCLVLCDRYFYDDIIGHRLARERAGGRALLGRIKALIRPRMIWRPDLTLYLEVGPDVAYGRKQDYPLDVMLRSNVMYRKVMPMYPEVVVVDADRSPADVRRAISGHIQTLLDGASEGRDRPRMAGLGSRFRSRLGKRLTALCLKHDFRSPGEWLIRHAGTWHPYVDDRIAEAPAVVDALRRMRGKGQSNLTSTGVLQYISRDWVDAVACGELSERSLRRNFAAWETLRQGPNADLVDYALKRRMEGETPVFSIERLDRVQCDGVVIDRLLVGLRGEMSPDHFSGQSFEAFRRALCDVAAIPRRQAEALMVVPEAGRVGFFHGDLHCENLLRNRHGRLVMVDLDRAQQNGPQVFDRIHCAVVARERKEGRHWLSFFSTRIAVQTDYPFPQLLHDVTVNSLTAYFLWRQSVEIANMPLPDRAYLERLRTCFRRMLGEKADMQ